MTAEEIRAAIASRPEVLSLVPDTAAIAAALSAGRTRLVERLITERRIISVLGIVDGDAFLTAMETFAASELPSEHPFAPVLPGLRRVLAWLMTDDGLDVGDASAQEMLTALGAAGVVNAAHAQVVADLARLPDPVSEFDVRCAIFADDGSLQV